MAGNKNVQYYSLADVNGTMGPTLGVPPAIFTGYGEDGGIEFSIESELHTKSVGADGHVAMNENNDRSVVATITVMETTNAYHRLYRLAKAQKAAKGLPPCPFFMLDPHNGDEVHEEFAVFQTYASPDKQSEAGERAFDIILPQARGDLILGGALVA